jgi:uncharacterized protein DUF4258
MDWPDWWEWEIEISSHCRKRMAERHFNEAELRSILEDAADLKEQAHGTFIVVSTRANVRWEVIVVPDFDQRKIVVISGYPEE